MKLNKKDESRLHGYRNMARSEPQYTDQIMIEALQEASNGQGSHLTRTQYQHYYEQHKGFVPHPFTIIKRYGRWNTALEAAGLPIIKRSEYQRVHTNALCLEAIRVCRSQLGHLPSVLEYNRVWKEGHGKHAPLKDEGYPSEGTIRARFGRWREALTKAANERER